VSQPSFTHAYTQENHNPVNADRIARTPLAAGDMATLEWGVEEHRVRIMAVVEHPLYGTLADVKMPHGRIRRVVMQLLKKRKPNAKSRQANAVSPTPGGVVSPGSNRH
jgi:hypothetical protein